MRKWFVAATVLVVVLAIPAAYAAASSNEKPNPATQAQNPEKNAATKCKAERQSTGVEAFQKKYGTNHNLRNAFGKCVSSKSKDNKDEKDEKDDRGREGREGRAVKRSRKGLQGRTGLHGSRGLRQEVRHEPQPEERVRQVRVGEVEVEGQRLARPTTSRTPRKQARRPSASRGGCTDPAARRDERGHPWLPADSQGDRAETLIHPHAHATRRC